MIPRSFEAFALDSAQGLPRPFFVLDEGEADVVVAVVAETDAVVTTSANPGRVTTTTPLLLPITPVSGRVKPVGSGAAESGVYSARFRQVFGTPLQGPAGGAGADAELL